MIDFPPLVATDAEWQLPHDLAAAAHTCSGVGSPPLRRHDKGFRLLMFRLLFLSFQALLVCFSEMGIFLFELLDTRLEFFILTTQCLYFLLQRNKCIMKSLLLSLVFFKRQILKCLFFFLTAFAPRVWLDVLLFESFVGQTTISLLLRTTFFGTFGV